MEIWQEKILWKSDMGFNLVGLSFRKVIINHIESGCVCLQVF